MSAIKNLVIAEKKNKDLVTKLTEADRERKSVKAALVGTEKQAEDQRQLRKAKVQLAIAQEKIDSQQKELEKKEEAIAQAEQVGYDVGVKEIEDALRA